MAFQPGHSAPDIVVWMFVFDIKKIVKKSTQRIPSNFTFLGTVHIWLHYSNCIYGIQPLIKFFQQDEFSGCHFVVPNIFFITY